MEMLEIYFKEIYQVANFWPLIEIKKKKNDFQYAS